MGKIVHIAVVNDHVDHFKAYVCYEDQKKGGKTVKRVDVIKDEKQYRKLLLKAVEDKRNG